ncbi:MAG: zinc ribbon domain-containing protein [Candidatus Lokiarchaeota archaeon]|nr:zinc ribbon domain-containing protein [Candidatus Lokiarchaeota archaeon]
MYCTECGSNIPDDAEFCPLCGKDLKKDKIRVKPTKTIYSEAKQNKSTIDSPLVTRVSQSPKTSSSSAGLIAARVFFVIIGVILLISGIITTAAGPYGIKLPLGLTLIIIGVVIIGVTNRGCCCGGGGSGGCSAPDCSGCDCDC